MKFTLVLFLVTASVSTISGADKDYCFNTLEASCKDPGSNAAFERINCNAKYSGFEYTGTEKHAPLALQHFAMKNVLESYRYMLLAANFGNYYKNRQGFQKYFQKLSDETWEDSIDVIKYITKRGSHMAFSRREIPKYSEYKEFELGSMTVALAVTKDLAKDAHEIHMLASKHIKHGDPEIASYIEEKFVHKHSSLIRDISGHANDLKKLYSSKSDSSIALFMFDEYLKS